MKTPYLRGAVLAFLLITWTAGAQSQQSLKTVLINLGAPSCGSTSPEQHLFTNVLSGSPTLLQACNTFPFWNGSLAYDPKSKKVYSGIDASSNTNIYMLDYNFTGVVSCPTVGSPLYTYNYQIAEFCFDADGNNLTLYNYDGSSQASIKRIDFSTGNDIPGTNKLIDFPVGNAPNDMTTGDLEVLPNGRVFAILGYNPSRLYELVNIDGPGNATAVYLATLPRNCWAIAYVDGNLIMGGSDGSGCYYYMWDINSNALGPRVNYPLGKTSFDMTNMNVGLGISQELIGATMVNANTADIIYQVHLKNKGNIDLTQLQLQSRLTDVFGAGNVSNVLAAFSANPAGLTLNPAYDGVTDINLLTPGQTLPNYPVSMDSLTITIQLRATNLVVNQTYLSSVIGGGQTGAGTNLLVVSDSSNNGNAAKIDPDNNGVSDDPGEGIPTPFMFNMLLASADLHFSGYLQENTTYLQWQAASRENPDAFELQRSADGIHFDAVNTFPAARGNAGSFRASDDVSRLQAPQLYYRLKLLNKDGTCTYSNIFEIPLKNGLKNGLKNLSVLPNPFTGYVKLKVKVRQNALLHITLYDCSGKTVKTQQSPLQPGDNYILVGGLQSLAKGIYILKTEDGMETIQHKLVK